MTAWNEPWAFDAGKVIRDWCGAADINQQLFGMWYLVNLSPLARVDATFVHISVDATFVHIGGAGAITTSLHVVGVLCSLNHGYAAGQRRRIVWKHTPRLVGAVLTGLAQMPSRLRTVVIASLPDPVRIYSEADERVFWNVFRTALAEVRRCRVAS